jgi:cyclase
MEHFAELFAHPGVDAGLAASIFHSRQVEIPALKMFLSGRGIPMRV